MLVFLLKVEERIAQELCQQGMLATQEKPHPRAPDYADLEKLTYLSCVIKEAMRVHTVSFYLIRQCLDKRAMAWYCDINAVTTLSGKASESWD